MGYEPEISELIVHSIRLVDIPPYLNTPEQIEAYVKDKLKEKNISSLLKELGATEVHVELEKVDCSDKISQQTLPHINIVTAKFKLD